MKLVDHSSRRSRGQLVGRKDQLSEDDDGAMPPRGERLTKEEILIIEQWIAGARALQLIRPRLVPR